MSKLAFVIGRNYSARLGMIRAAGMAGYEIIDIQLMQTNEKNDIEKIDASSKYVKEAYSIIKTTHDELIDFVIKKTPNGAEKVVLLPTDDFSAAAIDTQIFRLKGKYLFPYIIGEKGKIVTYMDKKKQKEMARNAGLNTVESWEVFFQDGKYIIPDGIKYPVFIKPQVSFQGVKTIMQKCDNQNHLELILDELAKQNDCPILVEEFVEIEKEYDVPGFACNQIIHTPGIIEKDIIHRGVTATGDINPISEYGDMDEKIKIYMQQFEFIGLFDLEMYLYKGKIYFNELNLRFGASGYAMTGSGINMPKLLIDTLNGEDIPLTFPPIAKKSFISEKTCFENYLDGSISWDKYKTKNANSNIHFIQNNDDKLPSKYFKKQQYIKHIKKEMKSILKNKLILRIGRFDTL